MSWSGSRKVGAEGDSRSYGARPDPRYIAAWTIKRRPSMPTWYRSSAERWATGH